MTPPQANTDLVTLATPVLQTILRFKADPEAYSGDLRSDLKTQIERMKSVYAEVEGPEKRLEAVRYALVGLADEVVLTSSPSFDVSWASRPLQLEYFEDQQAGVRFFERLE